MGMHTLVRKVLGEIGIRPERFSLQWASAAEAPRFVRLITDFTQQIKVLGPLGEAEGIAPAELKERLEKGLAVVSDRKLRMSYGTATRSIRKEANFTPEFIDATIDDKLAKAFASAFAAEPEGELETATVAAVASEKKGSPVKKKAAARKKK
jgi:F420-non-reducing hydrogenase iron-sulfur subunit